MVRMVSGMLDRLRLSKSADGQDTEHKQNRQNFEESVVHRKTATNTLKVMIMGLGKPCQAAGWATRSG